MAFTHEQTSRSPTRRRWRAWISVLLVLAAGYGVYRYVTRPDFVTQAVASCAPLRVISPVLAREPWVVIYEQPRVVASYDWRGRRRWRVAIPRHDWNGWSLGSNGNLYPAEDVQVSENGRYLAAAVLQRKTTLVRIWRDGVLIGEQRLALPRRLPNHFVCWVGIFPQDDGVTYLILERATPRLLVLKDRRCLAQGALPPHTVLSRQLRYVISYPTPDLLRYSLVFWGHGQVRLTQLFCIPIPPNQQWHPLDDGTIYADGVAIRRDGLRINATPEWTPHSGDGYTFTKTGVVEDRTGTAPLLSYYQPGSGDRWEMKLAARQENAVVDVVEMSDDGQLALFHQSHRLACPRLLTQLLYRIPGLFPTGIPEHTVAEELLYARPWTRLGRLMLPENSYRLPDGRRVAVRESYPAPDGRALLLVAEDENHTQACVFLKRR